MQLIVPHRDGRRVLAVGVGLPSIVVIAEPATLAALVEHLPAVGLHGPVVECVIDFTPDHQLVGERESVVQLAPHGDDDATGDRHWITWDRLEPSVTNALDAFTTEMIDEARGLAVPHARRVDWARSGWFDEATDWIRRCLRDTGRAAPDTITQFRHWGISAIMRVDAPDGRTWFKASYPHFAHEGPVTEHLAATTSAGVPSVLAVEPRRGWMLVDDLEPTEITAPDDQAAAVDRLVSIQAGQQARADQLVALGCPVRPLTELAAALDRALDSEVVAHLAVDGNRRRRLVEAVQRSAERVSAMRIPTTLVHGDFHPGNTATTDAGPVIFDWTDACLSSPVVDLATWAWWYSNDPARQVEIWGWFTEAWARHLDVDVTGLDRRSVDVVAGAFHLVSYTGLLEAVEPRRRFECADGLDHFLGLVEQTADSA